MLKIEEFILLADSFKPARGTPLLADGVWSLSRDDVLDCQIDHDVVARKGDLLLGVFGLSGGNPEDVNPLELVVRAGDTSIASFGVGPRMLPLHHPIDTVISVRVSPHPGWGSRQTIKGLLVRVARPLN
jgi:hypothetical protein